MKNKLYKLESNGSEYDKINFKKGRSEYYKGRINEYKNTEKICCRVGIIYALYFKGKPFYIGQTRNEILNRLKQHKQSCFIYPQDNLAYVYKFISSVTNYNSFDIDITIRALKFVPVNELNRCEMRYILYCLDKKANLFNNCNKTQSYVVTKYGVTINDYNIKICTNTI